MSRWTVAVLGMVIIALGFTACGDNGENVVDGNPPASQSTLNALPDPAIFYINLPSTSSVAGKLAKIGEPATFWELTRGAANSVNASVHNQIKIIDRIIPFPTLSSDATKTVWQLDQPLSIDEASVPQLTVERVGDTLWQYQLRERNKSNTDSWQDVWQLEMYVDQNEFGYGKGNWVMNFTAAAAADPTRSRRGSIALDFSANYNEDTEMTVSYIDYIGENDTTGVPRTYTYEYLRRKNSSGHFKFATLLNWSNKTDDLETLTVNTVWASDNRGLSQIIITGDDLIAQALDYVELRECWNEAFLQTYYLQIYYWTDNEPTYDKLAGDIDNCVTSFGSLDDDIDGDVTDGDVTDGDVTDGDVTDGDITDGDVTDGDVTDGDIDPDLALCLRFCEQINTCYGYSNPCDQLCEAPEQNLSAYGVPDTFCCETAANCDLFKQCWGDNESSSPDLSLCQ